MAERNLPAGLKTSLTAGDPYSYFHLVKFEKPRPSAGSGQTSGKATDYAYITDASININFDDASVDSRGSANLSQTYVANKLVSVGTVSETTEAKASSISLTLSGTALGTIIIANTSFTSSSMTADIDLLEAGFQEGDTLLLENAAENVNHGKYVRINTFTNNNRTVLITPIDTTITESATAVSYTLSYASEEVNSLILNKTGSTNYSSYINREAFIYRAHMNPETGVIIGAPFLIFRGIIAKGAVSDNMLTTSKITWSLTSHWGDFVRVQGRQTSDSQHRALSVTGEPDIDALIRPEYAQDPGFVHAESSVNVMAHYQTVEKKFRMRKRGGFAGLFGGQKMLEYTEVVDKEIDLQFNLEAKYLPVVYGVQKVDSFPIFADIKAQNPSSPSPTEVYIAHAICEGEISGILDIHVDDTTLICLDASDSDTRSGGGENVETVCYGRADRGDVLSGGNMLGALVTIDDNGEFDYGRVGQYLYPSPTYQIALGTAPSGFGGSGIKDGETMLLTSPLTTSLYVHTGKPNQLADNTLVNLAKSSSFKIQQDYYSGAPADYWGTSHRLLDTAYVVGKYTINEGETTIPKLEFVVKGSTLECYNYDYSYLANGTQPDGAHGDFLLGDLVTLHHTVGDVQIGSSSITIIDKWSYYDENSSLSYRFRFSDNPQTTTSVGAFYMKNAAGDKWYMSTYNALEIDKVALPAQPGYEIASASLNATGTWLNLQMSQPTTFSILGKPYGTPIAVTFPETVATASFMLVGFQGPGGIVPTVNEGPASQAIINNIAKGLTPTLTIANRITLPTGSSPVDNFYNNKNLTVTRYIDDVIVEEITRKVIDYDGNTKVAVLDSGFPPSFIPNSTTDVVSIRSFGDKRVSINPAIQLLDYLTSTRYGKGLKHSDLNLSTFLESARYCDTRSDVIVQVAGTATVPKDTIYKYEIGGTLIFQGKVKSNSVPNTINVAGSDTIFQEVTFTEVIGKLAHKWNNWKAFPTGYPIWNNGVVYLSTGNASTTLNSTVQTSLALTRVSGSGAASLALSINDGFTSSGNPIIKKFTNSLEGFNSPGYSLYDSDDVKYWAYLGWDEPVQRSVTRHQTNQVINTSSPLFDNINSMLLQFNGIMRYSNGKYELDIKRAAPTVFETYQVITEGDIFGELKVSDKGQKNTYNSMETSIIDPQNKFSGRGIKFFNSTYLKEDKGIRRAGNFAMPGISNYYNARINIKQYLDTSRFGLDIDFTIDSKGYLLLAGTIIQLSYARFGWENKLFRIENLNFNTNGLVQVTASEHNDEAFLIGNIQGSAASQISDASGGGSNQDASSLPIGPTNLQATTNAVVGITLTWDNSANFKKATHSTEVYASTVNDRSTALIQAGPRFITSAETVTDTVVEDQLVTKYYWIRHTVNTSNNRQLASAFYPTSATGGIVGSASGGIGAEGFNAAAVKLTSSDYSIVYDEEGANPTPSSITFTATSQNIGDPWFKFAGNITAETSFTDGATSSSDTFTYSPPSGYFSTPKTIRVGVSEAGQTELAFDTISIFGVKPGIDGTDGLTVIVSNEAHVLPTTTAGVVTYDGSGTTIEVYEGATALTYNGVGTTPSTWKITTSVTGTITVGTITGTNTTTATVADVVVMSTDSAGITYTITGETADGTEFTLTKTQSFAKSIQGDTGGGGAASRAVSLSAGTLAFVYANDGTTPSPTSTTITASSTNTDTESTVYYQFLKDGASVQNSATATYTYNPNASFGNMPDTIEVKIREGSDTAAVVASDTLLMVGLRDVADGVDALTLVMSNEAHTFSADEDSLVSSFTGGNTTIRLYEGTTELTYDGTGTSNGTWKIASAVGTGITANTPHTDSGAFATTLVPSAMTSDSASILYTITGKRADGSAITLTKTQSFSKSIAGTTGNNGATVNVIFKRSSTKPNPPTASATINPATNGGWYDSPPTGTGLLWASTGVTAVNGTVYTWGATYQIESSLVVEKYIYRKGSTAGYTGGIYNFVTGAFTQPTNWSTSPIALTSDGDIVYVSVGIFEGGPTTTSATAISQSAPVAYSLYTVGPPSTEPGLTGPRTATGYVYYQVSSATAPTKPSNNLAYNFSNGNFGANLPTNWAISAPEFVAGNSNKYWYCTYTVVETVFNGTQTSVFGSPAVGIGFSGLVTFDGANLSDGGTTYNPATVVNANTTTINGGKITAGSVDALQLTISSNTSGNSSMFFDGANNRIDIKDSGGTLRVRLGKLT